jgi:hypothetical protein
MLFYGLKIRNFIFTVLKIDILMILIFLTSYNCSFSKIFIL